MNDDLPAAGSETTKTLEIEPASMKASGRCRCCGKARRTAWGYVFSDGGPRACYFVEWTVGQRACGARVDVVVGDWNDGSSEDDRSALSFEQHLVAGSSVLDGAASAGRPAAEVGRATTAIEVAGTALDAEARTIARTILANDLRLAELTASIESPAR